MNREECDKRYFEYEDNLDRVLKLTRCFGRLAAYYGGMARRANLDQLSRPDLVDLQGNWTPEATVSEIRLKTMESCDSDLEVVVIESLCNLLEQ